MQTRQLASSRLLMWLPTAWAGVSALIEHLVDTWPGSSLATSLCLSVSLGTFNEAWHKDVAGGAYRSRHATTAGPAPFPPHRTSAATHLTRQLRDILSLKIGTPAS